MVKKAGRPSDDLAVDAIVVAAGSSSRMGGIDKLTAPVAGRPLLAWTLSALDAAPVVARIVVVVAADRVDEVASAPWRPPKVLAVVAGGARRQSSVAAGLRAVEALDGPPDRVVLVHDGARPIVRPELVAAVAHAAAQHGAAIPVLERAETLKRVVGGVVAETIDRTGVVAAQTPQGARLSLLRRAFESAAEGPEFTDEAAALEACRIPVHAIPGDPDNLKVTLPVDLQRAAAVLSPSRSLIGFGHDGHPFGPGAPLVLGGIEVTGAPRLHGHSDGDVVLHAVADALLGAAGLGDLGTLFPADDRTPRGIASTDLVEDVIRRLADAGLAPASLDITIIAARPRLGDRRDAIRERIADLAGLESGRVNVKASTGNLDGMEGAGRGISSRVVAVVERVS